jgi:hypothetical protein
MNDTQETLYRKYVPKSYAYELQTPEVLKNWTYKDTLAYANTTGQRLQNFTNVCYQMYSRSQARDILHKYVQETGTLYDFVLTTRFDIICMPRNDNKDYLDICTLDNKVYLSDVLCPRLAIPDNCILAPTDVYFKWFALRDSSFLNDPNLQKKFLEANEMFDINAEEVLLAKFLSLYEFDVRFFKGGLLKQL